MRAPRPYARAVGFHMCRLDREVPGFPHVKSPIRRARIDRAVAHHDVTRLHDDAWRISAARDEADALDVQRVAERYVRNEARAPRRGLDHRIVAASVGRDGQRDVDKHRSSTGHSLVGRQDEDCRVRRRATGGQLQRREHVATLAAAIDHERRMPGNARHFRRPVRGSMVFGRTAVAVAAVVAADLGNRIERVDLRGGFAGAPVIGPIAVRIRAGRRGGEPQRGGEDERAPVARVQARRREYRVHGYLLAP